MLLSKVVNLTRVSAQSALQGRIYPVSRIPTLLRPVSGRSLLPALHARQTASFHSSASRSGSWGPGLFENDQILDFLWLVEDVNGHKLRFFETEAEEKQAIKVLSRPHISSTISKLIPTKESWGSPLGPPVYIACCMQLGVKSYKKDLAIAERWAKITIKFGDDWDAGMYKPLLEGIRNYKNDGVTKWEPRELGLFATMSLGQELSQAYRDGEDEAVIVSRFEAQEAAKAEAKKAKTEDGAEVKAGNSGKLKVNINSAH